MHSFRIQFVFYIYPIFAITTLYAYYVDKSKCKICHYFIFISRLTLYFLYSNYHHFILSIQC